MSRKLSYTAHFPFEARLVYDTACNKHFWDTIFKEFKEYTPDAQVLSFDTNDEETTIVTKLVLPHEFLPPLAQTVVKFDMVVTREDAFGKFNPEQTHGTFKASIPAGPGWMKGWQELNSAPNGCSLRRTAEVKVFLPFIGGKLEQLILINLIELAKAEAELMIIYIYRTLGLDPLDYPESFGEPSKYYQADHKNLFLDVTP